MANAPATKPPTPPADPDPAQESTGAALRRLTDENATLRAQLAAAGRPAGAQAAQHTFQLSEGDRQELEIRGVVNIGGRAMTKADVEKAMAAAGQRGVEIADAPAETRIDAPGLTVTGPGIRGIDYVYPSVERGKIDPAVAGVPGINGPAADEK